MNSDTVIPRGIKLGALTSSLLCCLILLSSVKSVAYQLQEMAPRCTFSVPWSPIFGSFASTIQVWFPYGYPYGENMPSDMEHLPKRQSIYDYVSFFSSTSTRGVNARIARFQDQVTRERTFVIVEPTNGYYSSVSIDRAGNALWRITQNPDHVLQREPQLFADPEFNEAIFPFAIQATAPELPITFEGNCEANK